jgi:hypothetical protein
VEEEMTAALAWAERNGYRVDYHPDTLTARMPLEGATSGETAPEPYLLAGSFEGYRAFPPSWRFLHPHTEEDVGPSAYPAALQPSPFGSGLFTTGGPTGALICAHFNRLAFKEAGGIHEDWGALTDWQNPPAGYTIALTIGQMLQRIALETRVSSARMAPLA